MTRKSNRIQNGICSDIQDTIYEFIDSNNGPEDYPHIAEHVKYCSSCRKFYHTHASLRNYFNTSQKLKLKADPRIPKNVQNYFEMKKHLNRRGSGKFVDWVQSLFTFKIPVYQVLSGLAIALVLVMFLSGAKSSSGFWWMEIDYSGQKEAFENTNLYVLDTLHLLNTSNGQNAMEDSILVGFLESTL